MMLQDSSQWISNGINEYEKINDVELHIVAPHRNICGVQEFQINGIYYHFFRSRSDSSLFKKMFCKPQIFSDYRKNRIVIKKIDYREKVLAIF